MEKLTNVFLTDYIPTIYTTPRTMFYNQNGVRRKWDIFAERNGVLIVLYNSTRDVLILVKQFRPAVYLQQIPEHERTNGNINVEKYPASLGITLEFCAGLEDKNIPSEEIAKEEILEECGYNVSIDQIEKIATFPNLSETTGARTTFYYCQVVDDMKVSEGGGVAGENIQVVEMPVREALELVNNSGYVSAPTNFLFGIYWFLYNKYNKK